ncbi:unnamed protein product, partial [Rangifer tarandus platyrhynchus]
LRPGSPSGRNGVLRRALFQPQLLTSYPSAPPVTPRPAPLQPPRRGRPEPSAAARTRPARSSSREPQAPGLLESKGYAETPSREPAGSPSPGRGLRGSERRGCCGHRAPAATHPSCAGLAGGRRARTQGSAAIYQTPFAPGRTMT